MNANARSVCVDNLILFCFSGGWWTFWQWWTSEWGRGRRGLSENDYSKSINVSWCACL